MWCFLVLLATINLVITPSLFAIGVILINLYVVCIRYQEHKELRAEYDRRYSRATYIPVDQSKETE